MKVGSKAVSLLVVGVLTMGAAPSVATGYEATPELVDLTDVDYDFDLSNDLASAVIAARADANYAGEWFENDTESLTLFTVGDPSAQLRTLPKTFKSNLQIRWERAPHTLDELEAASDALIAQGLASGVSLRNDATGLDAFYDLNETRQAVLPRAQGGVSISWIAVDGEPAAPADTRQSDTAPFEAGSRITSSAGGCSSGLPVTRNDNNTPGILTASHCSGWGATGINWKSYGSSASLGTSRALKSNLLDAQFIRGNTTYAKQTFTGNYTSGTKRVFARRPPHIDGVAIGMRVVVSGGYSGAQAGDIVGRYTAGVSANFPYGINNVWRIESVDNTAIAGKGDSGAAVVQNVSGYALPVGLLSGMLVGAGNVKSCKGVPGSSARTCSNTALVSQWNRISSALDVRLHADPQVWGVIGGPF